MPQSTSTTGESPSRAEILRRREALGEHLAAWRESMGGDVATWPDELRDEYAELSQEWFRLGLMADDLPRA